MMARFGKTLSPTTPQQVDDLHVLQEPQLLRIELHNSKTRYGQKSGLNSVKSSSESQTIKSLFIWAHPFRIFYFFFLFVYSFETFWPEESDQSATDTVMPELINLMFYLYKKGWHGTLEKPTISDCRCTGKRVCRIHCFTKDATCSISLKLVFWQTTFWQFFFFNFCRP